MVDLSDDDVKEVFLADLLYGMTEREHQTRSNCYRPEKKDAIDRMVNRMHSENTKRKT